MNTVFTNANSSWRFPSSPKESNQSRKKTRVTAAQSQQKQEHSRIRGPTLCWLSLSRFLIIYDKDQGHTLCGVLGLSGIAKLSWVYGKMAPCHRKQGDMVPSIQTWAELLSGSPAAIVPSGLPSYHLCAFVSASLSLFSVLSFYLDNFLGLFVTHHKCHFIMKPFKTLCRLRLLLFLVPPYHLGHP